MPDPHTAWSPFLRASFGVHAAALALPVFLPGAWPWSVAALVANHALITAAGLWPRSNWLGPNLTRLPEAAARRCEVAVTIDDGPDPEVTPTVLDQLREHGAHATFFCIAERARRHPALLRASWPRPQRCRTTACGTGITFRCWAQPALRASSSAAQEVLGDLTASAARFFRAPAGLRNPFLDPVLHRLGLHLVTSGRAAASTPASATRTECSPLVQGPGCGATSCCCTMAMPRRAADGRAVVLHVLPALLQQLQRRLGAVTGPGADGWHPAPTPCPSPADALEYLLRMTDTLAPKPVPAPRDATPAAAWRLLHESGLCAVPALRPLRLALRARQAGARPGVPRHARAG
jgi:peptidoglycan/xylan/chitin deacetylase (PgdA/CDA1 family)